jgi:alpha-1,6-mannosyltransferase
MKVCDLALFSPETSSGVKTYITSKIAYVRRRKDLEHVVIVPGRTEHVGVQGRSKVIVVPGVPSFYPGIRLAFNLWTIAEIVERERPDVIELNCQYTLPWAAFLATRRNRTPIVGIYHTDVPACVRHIAGGASNPIASVAERLAEWYEGLIYRHCTMTIILNSAMEARVKRLGVKRMCCLPCGVDADLFSPMRRDEGWRARLAISPESIVLLYAGRLSGEKEVDVMFDAFDQLSSPKFVLVVAGDGPGTPAACRYSESRPHVKYLGHVESRAELATVYASSDIFLSPGRHETFGIATLEAVCSGLPVVGIQNSGTAAFVPAALGMFTRAGDAEDFARGISTVARWPLVPLRSACHDFAAQHYSWDFVLDQYFEVYRQVIEAEAQTLA